MVYRIKSLQDIVGFFIFRIRGFLRFAPEYCVKKTLFKFIKTKSSQVNLVLCF